MLRYQAIVEALTQGTNITDWDYWASAPDSQHSDVGSLWPLTIQPRTMGVGIVEEYLVTAAIWRLTPEALRSGVAEYLDSITQLFGSEACSLGSVGASATVSTISLGTPSTSAPSSFQGPTGLWCAVSFVLKTQG